MLELGLSLAKNVLKNNRLSYNETNKQFLTDDMISKCMEKQNMCVPEIIKLVHFNNIHPENKNIYISNLKTNYVRIDDSVIACDISNLPLENNKVDVSVFCLSLMGSNYKEYLKEGYRILKPYGNMFIVEPQKKWENNSERLISELESIGLKVVDSYTSSRFLYIQCLKLK